MTAETSTSILVELAPERAAELIRLARELNKPVDELAKYFLEAEIEAQHGLRHGPRKRAYMYR